MVMTRFSCRPSGDVHAYTSPISAAGFATVAGESRWVEARATAAKAVKMTEAASTALSWRVRARTRTRWGSIAHVKTFMTRFLFEDSALILFRGPRENSKVR